MSNKKLSTRTEEMLLSEGPIQEASPVWSERWYNALQTAFPEAVYHRFKEKRMKDVVSWSSDGYRFFFSWHELDEDLQKWEADNADQKQPVSGGTDYLP